MTDAMTSDHRSISARTFESLQYLSVLAYILLLIWTPFPLGSAVSWGAGFFEIGVAACWILWVFGNYQNLTLVLPNRAFLWILAALFSSALLWGFLQALPIWPAGWNHPLWAMTRDVLHQNVQGTISIDPWRTKSEVLKLASYFACVLLSFSMARKPRFASMLFSAVVIISALYVLYGYGLLFFGTTQPQIIYAIRFPVRYVSGPFMLHNSFATYCGLAATASIARLVAWGSDAVIADRGARRLLLSLLQFLFGRGVIFLFAALLLVSGVIASASRGGAAAFLGGILVMAILAIFLARRSAARGASVAAIGLTLLPIAAFLVFNSDDLADRTNDLLDAGTADSVRLELWGAARRMIASAPWQGLGLGTFQDSYPLYASRALPFVMDKAHCDYLELLAGLGIPAAAAIFLAVGGSGIYCLMGAFRRRRNRYYALTAVCASVLVTIHSGVDFSLQMPAVALSYATLLGGGIAQSQRTSAAVTN